MTAFEAIRAGIEAGDVVVMDGAIGTELARRGAKMSMPLWSAQALLDCPDLLRGIHREYIRAGAQITTADTFRTARCTLEAAGYGHLSDELPDLAVSILLEAIDAEGKTGEVVPGGCLSPLVEGPDSPCPPMSDAELEKEHEEHAVRQALAGAELIFCETMVTVREAVISLRAARSAGLPAIVSFVPSDARHILSGETLDTAVRAVEPLAPFAIGLNCNTSEILDKGLATLRALTNLPVAAYAHMGVPVEHGSRDPGVNLSPSEYALKAETWRNMGVRLIGSCCGSNPEYTAALHERLVLQPEPGKSRQPPPAKA